MQFEGQKLLLNVSCVGITLNWGVLLGWSAVYGHVTFTTLLLYVACVLHTMVYDTIYSHQVCNKLNFVLFFLND